MNDSEDCEAGRSLPTNGDSSILALTERLVLRRMTEEDVSATYVDWLNDPEVNRYLESRFEKHTHLSVLDYVRATARHPLTVFAALVTHDGRHIGNIKAGPIDPHHLRADIGLLIGDRSCWGLGYATESISAMSDYLFQRHGLVKLTASAYAGNTASIRAFLRAGYAIEGTRLSHVASGPGRDDVVLLGKLPPSR